MPLPACNLENKYACVFGTIGPAKEEWGKPITDRIYEYWRGKAIVDYLRVKFETSNTGYPHMHVGLMFTSQQRMAMFVRQLQNFMWAKYKDDKPTGYAREKQYSVRLFNVPCMESVNDKVLRGTKLIDHYLDEPTKEKCVDGTNYTIEFDGFSIAAELHAWRDEAARGPVRDAAGDAHYALRAAIADRMEAYAKKYQAAQKRGVKLPELTKMILGNQPPIDRLAKDWKSFLEKSKI